MKSYKSRILEKKVLSAASSFKALLILGARQVGKSTLLKHLFPHAKNFLFDSILDPYHVQSDPDLFLDLNPPPLVLDEVQFVPALLSAVKRRVDQSDQMGLYYLTGSQNLTMLKAISETMTGRAAILHLQGMTLLERVGLGYEESWLVKYLSDPDTFIRSPKEIIPNIPSLTEVLWRGALPQALEVAQSNVSLFFNSYIQTYVERDLRLLERIDDLTLFGQFLYLLGALSAKEINHSQLGREIGITPQTAKRWLNALSASYQWLELPAFHSNTIKRISEKKKGLLSDSGIVCHLLRIFSPQDLATHPLLGSVFETWVINHLQAICSGNVSYPAFYHWRAHSGAEIDLILDWNGRLYPIEIKCSRNLSTYDLKNFHSFRETFPHKKIAPGLIIHAGDENYLIDHSTLALSWKTY